MSRFFFASLFSLAASLAVPQAIGAATARPHPTDDSQGYRLVMHTADGSHTAYALGSHPRLTISGSTFTVTTGAGGGSSTSAGGATQGSVAHYMADDLRRFTLEDADGEPVANAYWLVISLRDGTIDAYPLLDRPKITIDGGTFSVVSASRTVGYELTSIGRFRVTDDFNGDPHPVNADVNGDGAVDVADISTVVSVMAQGADAPPASADVNGDGTVDVADIAAIISTMASGKM